MTFPPACAVFSIASNTLNRLKVYAWQPMAKPPVLQSSGIFSAHTVGDTSSGVSATQRLRSKNFIGFSDLFWIGRIATSKRGGVKAKSAVVLDPQRGAPAPPESTPSERAARELAAPSRADSIRTRGQSSGTTHHGSRHDHPQELPMDGEPRGQFAGLFAIQLQRRSARCSQVDGLSLKMARAAGLVQSAGDDAPSAGNHRPAREAREHAHIEQAV